QIKQPGQLGVRSRAALVRQHGPLPERHVIRIRHGAIEVHFGRLLKWEPGLVSRLSDSVHKSRSAAPGWQGARSSNIGHIRATSNAARRDAPPANYVANP